METFYRSRVSVFVFGPIHKIGLSLNYFRNPKLDKTFSTSSSSPVPSPSCQGRHRTGRPTGNVSTVDTPS